MQELHMSRACSLSFQEACLLWKGFVNDWSEVMAEARPGPDDALRLQARFCMLLQCLLCSSPTQTLRQAAGMPPHASQAPAVPLVDLAAGHAAAPRGLQVLPGASSGLSCRSNCVTPQRGRLPALCRLFGGRGYPVARHSLGGPLFRLIRHLSPPDTTACCLQEGVTTFSHWILGLAFGNPTLMQQLAQQPLDASAQAAPVQAVPDANMYETLLVRYTVMTRSGLARPTRVCHVHHAGLRAPQRCFGAAAPEHGWRSGVSPLFSPRRCSLEGTQPVASFDMALQHHRVTLLLCAACHSSPDKGRGCITGFSAGCLHQSQTPNRGAALLH